MSTTHYSWHGAVMAYHSATLQLDIIVYNIYNVSTTRYHIIDNMSY